LKNILDVNQIKQLSFIDWRILWESLVQRISANILKKPRCRIISIKIVGERARKSNQKLWIRNQGPENQLQDNLIRIFLKMHIQNCL